MSETKGNKTTGRSGDPNTTTSGDKSGTGTTNTGKQSEKVSESNLVEQGSPAGVVIEIQTDNKGEKKTVPNRKKPPAKKKITPKERSEAEKVKDIQSLLEGIFMVASLKAGSHWQLQPDESKQIATPLSRILERYDLLGKASEVSDPVALIVATATIVFPRIMVTKMTADSKTKETLKKNGVIADVKEKKVDGGNSGSNVGTAKTTNTSNDGQFIKSIHNEIQTGI